MEPVAEFLITVGTLLLLSLLVTMLAKSTILPRATLLLLLGVAIGNQGLDLLPGTVTEQFDVIANITLLMVGFLLGGKLTRTTLKNTAMEVLSISVFAAVITLFLVSFGLYFLLAVPFDLSLLLGCIASATAPAAVLDVVEQTNPNSRFGKTLLSIVAIDDIWALLLFAVGVAVVHSLNGNGDAASWISIVLHELGGALLLGGILGIPAAALTGRIKPGQPILTEALGLVLLCGGLALWLNVSFLISAIALGLMIANLASHHEYPFHAIENVETPFMVIFFVVAGAQLDLSFLWQLGWVGTGYILLRSVGKCLGGYVGAAVVDSDSVLRRWIGPALLPQAGVAIGMALVASSHFPEYEQWLLSIVISTTIVFEILGPVLTRRAIDKSNAIELA